MADAGPLVNMMLDRFGLGSLKSWAADMITVVVRDQQIVDALDSRIVRRREDALRIARVRGIARHRAEPAGSREAGVDEHRLPGRRDDERGLPALDIDEVDLKCSRRGRLCQPQRRDPTHNGCPCDAQGGSSRSFHLDARGCLPRCNYIASREGIR